MEIKVLKFDERVNGTSFHDVTLQATPQQLIDLLGPPSTEENTGEDKANMDWELEVGGVVGTLYDWKYYRPLFLTEVVDFHVGAHSKLNAIAIKQAVLQKLHNVG